MKLLVLSFYFTPDLSAGSFRNTALVEALLDQLPDNASIDVITTLPNRYATFSSEAPSFEDKGALRIHRIALPTHQSGMADQSKAFRIFAGKARNIASQNQYDAVYATSSRLMTAALGAIIARSQKAPLYLDIRDIFVDTIGDVLPRKIAFVMKPFFSLIEKWTLAQATSVNLVSPGFREYFQARYPEKSFSYFTNGIDDEFLDITKEEPPLSDDTNEPTILYAGNMGEGQGLHGIIPELARSLEGRARFQLIGDGGRRELLETRLREACVSNVSIEAPVKRNELIRLYQKADILFLHLNDHDAFKKVLPSKLFEYGAMGKPILAGVGGYAADFSRNELENSAVFTPCDATEGVKAFESLTLKTIPREQFVRKFARKNIMADMARDILSLSHHNP